MPTVFIIQEDAHKRFDAARDHGELRVLLKEREVRQLNNNQLMDVIHSRIKAFGPGDSLVLVGHPKVIGMVFMALNQYVTSFDVLVWDRLRYEYTRETIDE